MHPLSRLPALHLNNQKREDKLNDGRRREDDEAEWENEASQASSGRTDATEDGGREVVAGEGGLGPSNGTRKISLSELVARRKKERAAQGAKDGKGDGDANAGVAAPRVRAKSKNVREANVGQALPKTERRDAGRLGPGSASVPLETLEMHRHRDTHTASVPLEALEVSSTLLAAGSAPSTDGGQDSQSQAQVVSASTKGNAQAGTSGLDNARETLRRLKEVGSSADQKVTVVRRAGVRACHVGQPPHRTRAVGSLGTPKLPS